MGLGSFIFGKAFGATQARMKEAAFSEFAYLIHALDAWNADRDDFEALRLALHHFTVYDTRRRDYVADPTGRSLPAERALLSSYWIEALRESQLIGDDGRPSLWNEGAASFWASIQRLRDERDKLMLQNHFEV